MAKLTQETIDLRGDLLEKMLSLGATKDQLLAHKDEVNRMAAILTACRAMREVGLKAIDEGRDPLEALHEAKEAVCSRVVTL
jgi:hypothetical protein